MQGTVRGRDFGNKPKGLNLLSVKLEETRGCWNFLLRRTSRILARHYDDALRPLGLRVTQFNVLAVLAQKGPTTLTDLSQVLAMERSAVARNLKPLERLGFVMVKPGDDKRTRVADVTGRGRKKLMQALPAWAEAQGEVSDSLGINEASHFVKLARKVSERLGEGR